MFSLLCFSGMAFLGTTNVLAWDGVDTWTGEPIEIEEGNLVRWREDIEVYHPADGYHHQEEVQEISDGELETYDYTTGEFHYYEMD